MEKTSQLQLDSIRNVDETFLGRSWAILDTPDERRGTGPRTIAKKGATTVQVKIAARHGHLKDETQGLIREKAMKLLHLFERLTMIEVTVDLKKAEEVQVEFVVQAEHKHDIVASETNPDLMTACDLALHKVQAQLRRYKEKLQDHRRTPSAGEVTGNEPQ
jgi:putative sigma-54 modulation protein